jgi:hypothetical protein
MPCGWEPGKPTLPKGEEPPQSLKRFGRSGNPGMPFEDCPHHISIYCESSRLALEDRFLGAFEKDEFSTLIFTGAVGTFRINSLILHKGNEF